MRFRPFASTDCLDWNTKKDNPIILVLEDHEICLVQDSG